MSTAPPPAAPAEEKPAEGGDEPRAPNPQHISAQKRVQQQRAQVDEVVDIMRTNVEKVLERDKKLSDLQQSADALEEGASQFEKQACKLKSKFWWKNCKMLAIMIGIGVVIVIIIVVYIYGNM